MKECTRVRTATSMSYRLLLLLIGSVLATILQMRLHSSPASATQDRIDQAITRYRSSPLTLPQASDRPIITALELLSARKTLSAGLIEQLSAGDLIFLYELAQGGSSEGAQSAGSTVWKRLTTTDPERYAYAAQRLTEDPSRQEH